ncbi:putative autophagy protein Atg27 [Suillus bovinus]|uniref:putative autophagy protein Atg27 n=1 Tax=Suillus bovinus TaxID=48563 RepID=UPI001B860A7C|nr:putative autophagy protein Atg27 [Suillus bovinus]KAG2129821.1 putative autophagy protein Atg27 [Suillus bovinus]
MIFQHFIPQSLPSNLLSLLVLLSSTVLVTAEDFDCHYVSTGGSKWDLTPLKGSHTVSRTRDSPPTTMVDELRFNLCKNLKPMHGVSDDEQCPTGTRACLRKINKKSESTDRVIAVIPVASTSDIEPVLSQLDSPKGLSLTFSGSRYPSSSDALQFINFSLFCADDADPKADPTFVSYENGVVRVDWSSPAACALPDDQPPPQTPPQAPPEDEDDEDTPADEGGGESDAKPAKRGSGLGFFFLVLLLAFATYFILGAYYNYSTYGARGVDLIPHRDFWREVPYMLQDVVSHLCSTVRPQRSTRGGYIAV